ncbi:D-alanyl-D-alanine carboxypeptidase/D-alanyl-D-alanine-endopeptidase [Tessaracoccus sp. OH4464_COT-324]|uniref:D-alanyl-D-alanine carboxypeptidase/D-alanyl-D-alanine endopeptidase n=1 Tax=Tessaracoccus sp. OH4464_COT-324 TaxID=2491059 RepID=UPI00131A3313|nr:D-alanyl-D-alanine carboxypeptidase/D-alanyl-D-alanine-endopeptidase [Tessaracoccus sp. OH4464_COT-324]
MLEVSALKSRIAQLVTAGVLTLLFGAVAALGVAFRAPLLAATGLDLPAAASTVAPTAFPSPTPSEQPKNLLQSAQPPKPSKAVDPDALASQLAAVDASGLADPAGAPAVLAWEVVDVASGEVLASRNPTSALIPASNTKTLTIVALFTAFDGTERFATRTVVEPDGTVVLVGGGDPLLTAEPVAGYPAPASLRALAEATAAKLSARSLTTVRLGYDTSHFADDPWNDAWPGNYRDQVSPISALWADEGKVGGVRQADPALAAAQVFAAQLGELGVTVEGIAAARATGQELARVESPTVHVLAEQAMQRSNNSFTEVLGRQLAGKLGKPTTFAGATEAIRESLVAQGIWEEGARLDDASGLSRSNRFSARMLATANARLVNVARLNNVFDGLPVAGVTGTLHDRFRDGPAVQARGIARAKTGTLSQVTSLGGVTTTADGAVVAFGIIANGQVDGYRAKVWADQLVGVITGCGC